jgi:hypothetical protein
MIFFTSYTFMLPMEFSLAQLHPKEILNNSISRRFHSLSHFQLINVQDFPLALQLQRLFYKNTSFTLAIGVRIVSY